jgi:hypothetical protein
MIEFKGTYSHESSADSRSVLVQFDGVLLHIWHLSDPFYRLLTSDVFHLSCKQFGGNHRIKLPNGGFIETEDHDAMILLRNKYHPLMHRLIDKRLMAQGIVAILLTLFVVGSIWIMLNEKLWGLLNKTIFNIAVNG